MRFNIKTKEVLFQVALHIVVFLFYSFDKDEPSIRPYQFSFFLNYVVAALVINYVLLPRFLYKKKYWQMMFWFAVVVAMVIVVEEELLEQIYFPDTRGRHFSSVIYNLLGTLPTLCILMGFKFAWDALTKQQELNTLKSVINESELHYLQSQVNPHFLFNNLNNLYAHALENSPKTSEIILQLSGVMRYMLYECKEPRVAIEKEVEHLHNFISLAKLQLPEGTKVDFTTEVNNKGIQLAPLILIMFVENAFKHVEAKPGDLPEISISLKVDAVGNLYLKCRNSSNQNKNTQGLDSGIGLDNVKKRLELIYPSAHNLEIEENEGMYIVNLAIQT